MRLVEADPSSTSPGQAAPPVDKKIGPSQAEGGEIASDDPAYFNAIPGVKQVFTEDALLDLWVRDQQIAWLKSSDEAYNVDELRDRVRKRVQAIKTKELHSTVRGLRTELISYTLFVILFSMVLTAFTLSEAYPFATKVKAHVLKEYQGAQFSDVTSPDDAWNWVVNQLTPAIFSPWSAPYENSDQRNVMIGAVQLCGRDAGAHLRARGREGGLCAEAQGRLSRVGAPGWDRGWG